MHRIPSTQPLLIMPCPARAHCRPPSPPPDGSLPPSPARPPAGTLALVQRWSSHSRQPAPYLSLQDLHTTPASLYALTAGGAHWATHCSTQGGGAGRRKLGGVSWVTIAGEAAASLLHGKN